MIWKQNGNPEENMKGFYRFSIENNYTEEIIYVTKG